MRGVPLRIELGPRDIENGQVIVVRRDNGEKTAVAIGEIENYVKDALDGIQKNLYAKALKALEEKTYSAAAMDETMGGRPGFVKAMWCGSPSCEETIKEKTGLTSRCIPFEGESVSDKCVCCGGEAKHLVYWGKSY
jgi:prolyl-tRNA synthetase